MDDYTKFFEISNFLMQFCKLNKYYKDISELRNKVKIIHKLDKNGYLRILSPKIMLDQIFVTWSCSLKKASF